MPELIIELPDHIREQMLEDYDGHAYLWDNVVDEDRDIVALYLDCSPYPCGVEDYYFETGDDARDEAWRLNQLMGLSDDDIYERIGIVMEREGAPPPPIPEPGELQKLADEFVKRMSDKH